MSNKENPRITLVGAGPGDVELISVKGLNRLKKANVVLYDALVNEELLSYAPTAKKIFVGKRLGFKAYEQEQINQLMVDSAREFGQVVRLKGGDSFVFGRGMEEVLFARKHQIPTEIIPGISSSISVPALAEIPVTHRGISNSFFVLSATLADGSLNPELRKTAELNTTIIILMGISQLAKIMALYQSVNKGSIPVSVVYNGSLETQHEVFGTVDTIVEQNEHNQVYGPGVIIIGEVVSLASNYSEKVSSESFNCCHS